MRTAAKSRGDRSVVEDLLMSVIFPPVFCMLVLQVLNFNLNYYLLELLVRGPSGLALAHPHGEHAMTPGGVKNVTDQPTDKAFLGVGRTIL